MSIIWLVSSLSLSKVHINATWYCEASRCGVSAYAYGNVHKVPIMAGDAGMTDLQKHCRSCTGVQVSTRLCTAVSCRAMCTGRRRHGAPQSALRHSRSTKFPSVQHDKLWPSSIFVRRSSCLELIATCDKPLQSTFSSALLKLFLFRQISRSAH